MERMCRNGRFANVTSMLALVVALGGTAYAANTVRSRDIVDGQVKNRDLGSSAVTSQKVRNGALQRADLAGGSVTSATVRNGTLLTKDFKAGQLKSEIQQLEGLRGPAGPAGATGAAGATGPAGPAGPAGPRAFGRVNTEGEISQFRNAAARRAGTGLFCIKPDPAAVPNISQAIVIASPDHGASASPYHVAMYRHDNAGCNADEKTVRTFRTEGPDIAYPAQQPENASFSFMIP